MSRLSKLKAPIKQELEAFELFFKETMKSKVPLLDRITYYIVKRKGKQLRPMFVLNCAKMCGKISETTFIAASMVELLHTATLVHDDVVDDAQLRRGFFSINALWKNKAAVLVGDYLLSKGLLIAIENQKYRLLEVLSKAVKDMSEGELLQMEKSRSLDIDEDTYFEIIRMKTASLIAASCEAGAVSSTTDENIIQEIYSFGEKIGIAFQLKDDLFDYGENDVGKPVGNDLKEKKLTLPLIYLLQQKSDRERNALLRQIKKHHDNNQKMKKIIEEVRSSGGLEYTRDKMKAYKSEALKHIDRIKSDPVMTEHMHDLVTYVIDRKK
jgi:octaprenyl-diphosphate synthase